MEASTGRRQGNKDLGQNEIVNGTSTCGSPELLPCPTRCGIASLRPNTTNNSETSKLLTSYIAASDDTQLISALRVGEIMAQTLDVDTVFQVLKASLPTHGKALVKQCASVYSFDITTVSGGKAQYTLDLSQGSGSVERGLRADANATVLISDALLVDFFLGRCTIKDLYLSGTIKVVGSMGRVTRLKPSALPMFSPDNLRKFIRPKL